MLGSAAAGHGAFLCRMGARLPRDPVGKISRVGYPVPRSIPIGIFLTITYTGFAAGWIALRRSIDFIRGAASCRSACEFSEPPRWIRVSRIRLSVALVCDLQFAEIWPFFPITRSRKYGRRMQTDRVDSTAIASRIWIAAQVDRQADGVATSDSWRTAVLTLMRVLAAVRVWAPKAPGCRLLASIGQASWAAN